MHTKESWIKAAIDTLIVTQDVDEAQARSMAQEFLGNTVADYGSDWVHTIPSEQVKRYIRAESL